MGDSTEKQELKGGISLEDLNTKLIELGGGVDIVSNVIIEEPPELKGEHFATETVYAQVQYKDGRMPRNFFVKKYPINPLHADWTRKMKVMDKETNFYNKFLPLAQEFCKKYKGAQHFLDSFTEAVYCDEEIVVLNNLVLDHGFIMLDKFEYQDLTTAKLVLTNMARFHATTFALIENMGRENFLKDFSLTVHEAFDFKVNPDFALMFDNGINNATNILLANPKPGSDYTIKKLGEMIGKTVPEIVDLLTMDPSLPFSVLNHGDCWNNNMLFKKDTKTGKIIQHLFVDLQITRYGSPCLELGYFILTSVKPEVRGKHTIELLQHYYDEFCRSANVFSSICPISFGDFVKQYKKYAKLGFLFSLSMQSAIGAFKEIDFAEFTGKSPEEAMAAINEIIKNWINDNPEQADTTSTNLVSFVKDFEDLLNTSFTF